MEIPSEPGIPGRGEGALSNESFCLALIAVSVIIPVVVWLLWALEIRATLAPFSCIGIIPENVKIYLPLQLFSTLLFITGAMNLLRQNGKLGWKAVAAIALALCILISFFILLFINFMASGTACACSDCEVKAGSIMSISIPFILDILLKTGIFVGLHAERP